MFLHRQAHTEFDGYCIAAQLLVRVTMLVPKVVRRLPSYLATFIICLVVIVIYPRVNEPSTILQQDVLMWSGQHKSGHVDSCSRKNVLLLISDDLRPQLGSYKGRDSPDPINNQIVFTPNLDRLAQRSLLLKRAYAQWSSCGPSRSSFLTSRRPHTTKVWDLHTSWRDSGGNFTSLPQLFREHGYLTAGAGKVFHPLETDAHDSISWSVPFYDPPNLPYWSRVSTVGVSWKAVTRAERAQLPLEDEQTTEYTLNLLRSLAPRSKSCQKPFFIAAGFHKPHLPFVFPEEFIDMYPLGDILPPTNPYAPRDMPDVAWDDFIELRRYLDIKKLRNKGAINETLAHSSARLLRRAYYASVSYVDFLVGQILDELKRLEVDNSTIVAFVSDHGFSLGENGEWGKHTNFEQSLRVPMMLHIPGETDAGIESRSLVELLDLYPTLAEAAGLPHIPDCPTISVNDTTCTEGTSLIPLIRNPNMIIKDAVYSQHKRNNLRMGYSVRTDHFRYTEWVQISRSWSSFERWDFHNNWDMPLGIELYDHTEDPLETINIAEHPGYISTRKILSENLRNHFRMTIFDFPRSTKSLFLDY